MRKTLLTAITALSMTASQAWADVQSEIAEVIHATAEAWNSQDHSNVLQYWDKDNETPYYLAEERDEWLIGWDELNGYLDPPVQSPAIQGIREEMSNIRVNQIADDLAFAVWDMHFEMKIIGRPPIGEDVRVSAIFRKKPEGWRYIQWAESPMTATMYIEKLMSRDVDLEKFNAAMANKKKK